MTHCSYAQCEKLETRHNPLRSKSILHPVTWFIGHSIFIYTHPFVVLESDGAFGRCESFHQTARGREHPP